jgi:O-succinylhomoserine sulfhydrylase
MERHCSNAQRLADWLVEQPAIKRVHYPGLASHPQHELACRQQQGFGGIVSFEVEGGKAAAWQVVDQTRILSITANLGDSKTTITHPATTTHGRLTQEERDRAGISDGLLRVAVGLEDVEDIQNDLERGLSKR